MSPLRSVLFALPLAISTVVAAQPAPDQVAAIEPPAAGTVTAQPPEAAPRSSTSLGWYAGGGALYIPTDPSLFVSSAVGGLRIEHGSLEVRAGARIAYGDGRDSSAVAVLAEARVIRWFGAFGLGADAGVGPIVASLKNPNGWDGLMPGVLATGGAHLRFDRLEPWAEIGVLYAVGNDYPQPFAMLGLTGRM